MTFVADDDVASAEAETLLAYARENNLPPEQLQLLTECLAGRAPLPPPNLGELKLRRVETLRAVRQLLLSDLHLAKEEEDVLAQVATLLA